MLNKFQNGTPFVVTATHATLASASKAGIAGQTHYVTTVSVSSDKAGSILLIKDGTTTIWQAQVGAGLFNLSFPTGLGATPGNLISAEVDGTSACKANICGMTVY